MCEISEILPYLFLGNRYDAGNKEVLSSKGITRILNCAVEISNTHPDAFEYLHLQFEDDTEQALEFSEAHAFILSGIHSQEGVVMCCTSGASNGSWCNLHISRGHSEYANFVGVGTWHFLQVCFHVQTCRHVGGGGGGGGYVYTF